MSADGAGYLICCLAILAAAELGQADYVTGLNKHHVIRALSAADGHVNTVLTVCDQSYSDSVQLHTPCYDPKS